MLNGLIKPDTGRIEMRGSVGAMIALGAGFNPVLTGRENIMIATSLARLSYSQTRDAIDEILEFAELGQFVDSPVQTYSSGMQVRLGFAAASTIRPDILILDEVLSVGDAGFRMKCFNKVLSIREIASVIFVSHSMHQIHRICTQSVVLSSGKQLFEGDISSAIAQYQNLFVKNHEKFDHIPGCKIQQIRVDNSIDKVINTKPGVPLHIEIDFDCSFESMNAHAIVSLQEQSGEIIFQASNMESPDHLHLPKGEFTLSLVFTPPKMGSTDKFLSIQIRNGDDQKIIAFAHQAWTFRVLNDSYIHASTYDVLSACVKSHT
jgi:ABC-type polysaccharide/polyol phosphate transport system ATPase subunit